MSDEMDELWSLFADDGAQAMDAMESALIALKDADPSEQAPYVAALFRGVHTFKGNSRVLGLGVIESRAHLAEDLIGLVRDQGVPLTEDILDLLLEAGDVMRAMLEETARTRGDVAPEATEGLMARLTQMIGRCHGNPALPAADPAPGAPDGFMDDTGPAPVSQGTGSGPLPDDAAHVGQDDDPDFGADDVPVDDGLFDAPPAAPPVVADSAAPVSASVARVKIDPAYRAIFDDMVADTRKRLAQAHAAADSALAARSVGDLAHAARQLGLTDWSAVLDGFDAARGVAALPDLLAQLDALAQADQAPVAVATAGPEPIASAAFFTAVVAPLSRISQMGISLSLGESLAVDTLVQAAAELADLATAQGFVRVAEAARALPAATETESFRRTELRLYEELVGVEDVLGDDSLSDDLSPSMLLRTWAADHVFDTIDELGVTLDRLRQGHDGQYRALERLVRLLHHACRHYELEMASQLAMSLLDLFGRCNTRGTAPDAILLRIARGFVDTLELVFDALREGETPDTAQLEQLFKEASEASFMGSGVATATAIERRLKLPREFQRVLSPESVAVAADSIAAGHTFYVLRADVNSDQALAEALFDFVGSGAVRAITNVTVFRGDETLFDFLLASPMREADIAGALARIDPMGQRLVLTGVLRADPEGDDIVSPGQTAQDMVPRSDLTAGVLERIGELAAGQAMVHGMLSDLAENDLVETIDAILSKSGLKSAMPVRAELVAMATQLMDRLRDLAQVETQLVAQMSELQQITAELRSRPVEVVLRPLTAEATALSRQSGRDLKVTTAGGDMALDVGLLDQMKQVLRPLVLARAKLGQGAPRRMHLAVDRDDDHLAITLDDDGAVPHDATLLARLREDLTRDRGTLRAIQTPGGGQRLHLALPMSLVVLEGMVVGIDSTRYVIPVEAIRTILQPAEARMTTVSAQGGARWLRLDRDEVVPVMPLSRIAGMALPLAGGDASRLRADRADHAGDALGQDQPGQPGHPEVHVVLRRGADSVSVPVDQVIGQQLVLLRPLRGVLTGLRHATGVALLSGGDVGIVLSPGALCQGLDKHGGRPTGWAHVA